MALRGATFRGSRLLSHAAVVLVALAVCAAAPGAAEASPAVGHVRTDTSVQGGGLIGPGKAISLDETINNSGDPLIGASGLLTTTTPGVTVTQGSSPYPDLNFSQEGANTTPFAATLDSSVACGTQLAFSLQVDAGSYSQAVPFTVPTGTSGPPTSYAAADLPKPIPDNGNISSSLSVTGGGLAKGITVRLGQIDHTYDGDLKIELIAPDSTSVVLVNRRGGDGHNFTNTVLSDSAGQSIASPAAQAPFSGSYRPEQPLSTFDGHPVAGTWQLKVSDQLAGDTGVIKAWGADIAPAVCSTDPIASFTANPSPAPPGAAVTFDASGSVEPKPGATITSYQWDFDGDGTPDQTTTTPTVSHSYAARGTYQVGLVVSDSVGDTSAPTTVPLIVTQPPTVTLAGSPNPVLAGSQLDLTATASDPDPGGSIVKYEWDLDGNGTFERDTGTAPTTSTTFSSPGTYTLRVRVTDADGATAVAPITVTVDPVGTTDQPPVPSFSAPSLVVAGQPATLDASGSSDPDGTVTRYQWDMDGNGTFETDTGSTPTVNHTFSAGQQTVGLLVTDNSGSTASTTGKINVVAPPSPGTLSASLPNAVALNTPVTFTDTGANDPNAGGSITKYEWDLDANGTFETDTGTTPSATHSYASNGQRTIKVRVTNAEGATAVATYTLVAANQPPAITQLTAAPNPAIVGQSVTFTVTASDPEGHGIARYDWDLDGNGGYETPSGASPTISYAYPNAGPIPVGVRVTDADGGQSTATVTLQVNEGQGGAGAGAGTGPSGGGGTGGGGTGGGGTGGGSSSTQNLRAGLVGLAVQRAATVRKRGLAVACRTNRAASCALTVEVGARDARRYGLRSRGPVVLGTASGSATVGRDARLSVRLNAAGRRLVGRARAISLLVRGIVRDRQGGRVPVTRVILVKR